MSSVDFKLDSDGIQALLKSDEVVHEIEAVGNQVLSRLSGDCVMDTMPGKYRAITRIKTADQTTFYKNLHTNEMLKAVHK